MTEMTHKHPLDPNRLEAFSDGVMAIIITISVLEMKAPIGHEVSALVPLIPVFLTYVVSFQTIGTYWNNHHHLIKAVNKVNGGIMWSNLLLLFWLSLIPFAAGWFGENHGGAWPTALYCFVLAMCAVSYFILQNAIIRQCEALHLQMIIGNDTKGKLSLAAYAVAIPAAFVSTWISIILVVAVAFMWLFPDERLELWIRKYGAKEIAGKVGK